MKINNLSKWFKTNQLETKILELILDAGVLVLFFQDLIAALVSEGENEEDVLQALADLTAKGIVTHCDYGDDLTTLFLTRDAMEYLCQIQEEDNVARPFKRKSKMTVGGTLTQELDDDGNVMSTCCLHSSCIFGNYGSLGEADIEVTVSGSDIDAIAKAQEEFFRNLSDDVSEDNFVFDIDEIDNINCE